MVGAERDIGRPRLADRLAVVDRLGVGEKLQILLDPVGDAVQEPRPLRRRRPSPCVARGMSGIERKLDVLRRGARHFGRALPSIGLGSVKYRPFTGATHFPPMKLSYRFRSLAGLMTES